MDSKTNDEVGFRMWECTDCGERGAGSYDELHKHLQGCRNYQHVKGLRDDAQRAAVRYAGRAEGYYQDGSPKAHELVTAFLDGVESERRRIWLLAVSYSRAAQSFPPDLLAKEPSVSFIEMGDLHRAINGHIQSTEEE